jgi:hypothetical protein
MQIHQVEELADYLQILRANRQEVQALFKDVLITVTNFFRDKEAFQFLEEEVIPKLFRDKAVGDQIRVWVIGCATGENRLAGQTTRRRFKSLPRTSARRRSSAHARDFIPKRFARTFPRNGWNASSSASRAATGSRRKCVNVSCLHRTTC